MTIAFRVTGTPSVNTTSPNPSFGAGAVSTDLNVLWVAAKPTFGKIPDDVVITTPSNWLKLGQWSNGSTSPDNPPGNTGSVLIAAYVRSGAFTGSLGAMTLTNVSVASAVIDTYSTTVGSGWDYSVVTYGTNVGGTDYTLSGQVTVSVAAGDFILGGSCVKDGTTLTGSSPTLSIPGVTMTGGAFRDNASSAVSSNNLGISSYDRSVSSGTATGAPAFAATTNTDGVTSFIRIRDTGQSAISADSITVIDRRSDVPQLRTWQNGQLVTATDMTARFNEPLNWLLGSTRPGIRVRNTSSIALQPSSETTVTWQTADLVRGSIAYYPGTKYIVVGEPGHYVGQISFSSEDIGTYNTGWALTGKLYIRRGTTQIDMVINSGPYMTIEVSQAIGGKPFSAFLRAGDSIELTLQGGYSSGGAQTWTSAVQYQPSLDLWWYSRWE